MKPRSPAPKDRSRPSRPMGRSRHRKPEKILEFAEADNRLYDLFRHHGFADYPHEKRQALARFYQILMKHQERDNVTRLLTLRDVAIKHFIDSLLVTRLVDLQFPLMDIGTGPGFPGIPLKIHFPDKPIILVEGVERRVQFLKQAREELGLKDLNIIGRYVTTEFVYPTRSVITRALADINQTLHQVSQCVQTGGLVYLMKGPNVDHEIRQAQSAWEGIFHLEKDIAYEIPSTPHQRRLVIYRKLPPRGGSPS
ncbi:MAG: 16S rRNA (guanine(527)-N(7))-methyltransferase RsmG [Bdellovibrionales bacterium]|nr:16S rRNA (guanine(527)-N(7))-methyltransferase RsmG [Bdellovibrionales bacterium]